MIISLKCLKMELSETKTKMFLDKEDEILNSKTQQVHTNPESQKYILSVYFSSGTSASKME